MIGAGIAQRTVFQGPKTETASISASQDAPYLLIHGSVLNRLPGAQTLRAEGDGDIFAAYGRTADMKAWLSDVDYNDVSLDKRGRIVTTKVAPEVEPSDGTTDGTGDGTSDGTAGAEGAGDAAEPAVPAHSPIGSDLWLDEFQQKDV